MGLALLGFLVATGLTEPALGAVEVTAMQFRDALTWHY